MSDVTDESAVCPFYNVTIQKDIKPSVSRFMAYAHSSVLELSKEYLSNERRYYYTTPKSFLEQVGGSYFQAHVINIIMVPLF